MANLSEDKREYARKSIWRQFQSSSRMSDQDNFSHALCLVKSCCDLSNFLATQNKLNVWICILYQSGEHSFKNFSGGSAPRPVLSSSRQGLQNSVYFLSFTNIHKNRSTEFSVKKVRMIAPQQMDVLCRISYKFRGVSQRVFPATSALED